MIYLKDLLKKVEYISRRGDLNIPVTGFHYDSRKIEKGMCFVAIRGYRENGMQYVGNAVARGASAILFESKPDETFPDMVGEATWIQVENARIALSKMAAVYYDQVAEKTYNIGVTGTNGKTTIVSLLHAILNKVEPSARLGTLGTVYNGIAQKTMLTTPEAPVIFDFLSEAVKRGCKNLVMEVSSVALKLHRVEDIHYSQAIFTTFTGDHLDFHKTMDDYFQSKLLLFKKLGMDDWAIINVDDPESGKIIEELNCRYLTYGFSEDADVRPLKKKLTLKGIQATLQTPKGPITIKSQLIGRVNLSNIMAAVTSAIIKGLKFETISNALSEIKPVKGRLDPAHTGKFSVLVDYAHTDKALEGALTSLKDIVKGRVIVVFGAGGARDKSKRPRMGQVAAEHADEIILTSDNPRNEEPQDIIDDIVKGFDKGFKKYTVEADRETAIEKALHMAKEHDVVLIAGKGHEDYQIFKDKTIHFDDFEVVNNVLAKMNRSGTKGGKNA